MASKSKLKTFSVSKRYVVWVDTYVKAESFEQAAVIRDSLKVSDFLTTTDGSSVNDYDPLPGGGIYESW